MIRYILSAIPVLFLLSTLIFQAFWNQFYQSLGIRFDLTPDQMWLLILIMNLFAASFGIPSFFYLLGKNPTAVPRGKVYRGLAIVSAVSVTILGFSAARWIILDPRATLTGVREFILNRKVNAQERPEIRDGFFRDAELGISFKLPENWEILTPNAIRRAHESGSRSISGRNQPPSEAQLPPEIDQFFAIKKYPESYSAYNPSLAFISYEKTAMKAQGISSLGDWISPWSTVGPPYTLVSGPSPEKIGVYEGYRVRLKRDFNGVLVHQQIFAFEIESHYISATVSIQDPKDRVVLEAVIQSIQDDD